MEDVQCLLSNPEPENLAIEAEDVALLTDIDGAADNQANNSTEDTDITQPVVQRMDQSEGVEAAATVVRRSSRRGRRRRSRRHRRPRALGGSKMQLQV